MLVNLRQLLELDRKYRAKSAVLVDYTPKPAISSYKMDCGKYTDENGVNQRIDSKVYTTNLDVQYYAVYCGGNVWLVADRTVDSLDLYGNWQVNLGPYTLKDIFRLYENVELGVKCNAWGFGHEVLLEMFLRVMPDNLRRVGPFWTGISFKIPSFYRLWDDGKYLYDEGLITVRNGMIEKTPLACTGTYPNSHSAGGSSYDILHQYEQHSYIRPLLVLPDNIYIDSDDIEKRPLRFIRK